MNKVWNALVVLLVGLVFSISASAMALCGKINLDKFYDVGEAETIQISSHEIAATEERQGWAYVTLEDKEWNWVYIKLSQVKNRDFRLKVCFYNLEGILVKETIEALHEGKNWISTEGCCYSKIYMEIVDYPEEKFYIDKMQFREERTETEPAEAIKFFCVFFCIYFIILLIAKKVFRQIRIRPVDLWIEFLQRIFRIAGGTGECLYARLGRKGTAIFRIAVVDLLFFYMQIIAFRGLYLNRNYMKYHMYFVCLLMIVLSLLCWEKPLQMLNWKTPIARSWFVLWGLVTISDFVVPKRLLFQGLIMTYVMSFFYFMLGNRRNKLDILYDIQKALKIWYGVNFVLCILFSPYLEGMRYQGISQNANIWAMYLIFVMGAFLSSIIERPREIRGWLCAAGNIFFAGTVWNMIIKTGSSSGVVPCIVCIGILSVLKLYQWIEDGKKMRGVCIAAAGVLCFLFSSAVGERLLSTDIMQRKEAADNNQIAAEVLQEFEGGIWENPFIETIHAAEKKGIQDNRVYQKIFNSNSIEQFTSGRTYFWEVYLRETNLLGHENFPELNGRRVSAHSGFVAILHRYGVLAIVPYILLIAYYAWNVLCKRNRSVGGDYCLLLMFLFCSYVLLLIENIEYPFYYIGWYCLYLPMGSFFAEECADKDIDRQIDAIYH